MSKARFVGGEAVELDLGFKGARDYLHGTDIIPAFLALTGPVETLSVQFHRMMHHGVSARVVTHTELQELRKSKRLCAVLTFKAHGADNVVAVTEDAGRLVTTSRPYDEEAVVRTANSSGNSIVQNVAAGGSFFERIVALNKRLLNDLRGKSAWLFARLDLSRFPADTAAIEIRQIAEIGGKTFKSGIWCEGLKVGDIYFSRNTEQ